MKTELHELLESRLRRRAFLLLGLTAFAGCSTPFLRGNKDRVGLDSLAAEQDENAVKLVSDYAAPWGLQYKKIEAVALVTNLDHTGSDPPPDGYRSMLLADMQGRDVKKPNDLLASDKTSLVLVTAYLPPAVKKGDPLDVELRVPTKSTTTSLRGGWLMQCRLREMAVVKGRTHTGHEAGLAQGNVVVSSIFLGEREKINEVRARVLGGAVAISERKLGLVVHRSDVSIETTSVIGNAVNARFHTFDRGEKKGVAEPKNANFIELLLPTRYRQNMGRFVNVVRAVPLRESAAQRLVRLEQLEQQLMNPETSLKASFALEAIGREGIPTLKKGLASPEVDVRFHAAEALAYLEEPEAAKVLTAAAREEAAFRRPRVPIVAK